MNQASILLGLGSMLVLLAAREHEANVLRSEEKCFSDRSYWAQGVLMTQVSLLGATDSLSFEAFIAQRLVPKLWAGACVLMDNCSIHKGAAIKALITGAGARLIYLPPYSPDCSPIENCWSKIKCLLRAMGARNYLDLVKAIEAAFEKVSLNDIQSWFTHCCYCTSED